MKTRLHIFIVLTILVMSIIGCIKDDGSVDEDNNETDITDTDISIFDDVPPVLESALKLLSPENEAIAITSEDTIFMWNDSHNSVDIRSLISYRLFIDENLEKIEALGEETRRGGEYFYCIDKFAIAPSGYTPSSFDDDYCSELVQFVISDMSFLEPNKKYYWRVSAWAATDNSRFYKSSVGEFTTGGF